MSTPALADPHWPRAYRIVNSSFPPIALFEDVLDPEDLEIAYALEALTNDRLIAQAGVLDRVRPEDRLSGPGSTPVMAAFTHIGKSSRFTDGTFGVYYAASSQAAAIAETVITGRFPQPPRSRPRLTMRTYVIGVVKPLHDIATTHPNLAQSDPMPTVLSQAFAGSYGGQSGGCFTTASLGRARCVAAFRPRQFRFRSRASI